MFKSSNLAQTASTPLARPQPGHQITSAVDALLTLNKRTSTQTGGPPTHLELHGGELVHGLRHGLPDDVPSDLVVGLRRRLHGVARQLVEGDHVLEHADRLVEGAEPIVRGVAAGRGTVIRFSDTWRTENCWHRHYRLRLECAVLAYNCHTLTIITSDLRP